MPVSLLVAWVLTADPDVPPAAVPPTPAEVARRDAIARFGVGVLRARDDRPVEAVRQFEAAAKNDPAAAAPLRELVPLYADLGRDAAAIRTAETVLRLDPDDADTAHTLGQLLYDAKRFADATKWLKQAADSPRLAGKPARRLGILRDLARACDAGHDPAGAADALRKAAAFAATHRDALLRSGNFPTAADLDRESAVIHEKLGQALAAQKKYDEADAALDAAARFYQAAGANPVRLEWQRCEVADGRGDAAAAVGHLSKYLALRPTNPEPYERLAELLAKAGQRGAVVPTLTRLAEQSPKVPAIRWVLASEIGRTDPARANALFREAAQTTAEPAFYKVAVRHYRETHRPGELLDFIDTLYAKSRVDAGDEEAPRSPGKKPVADPVAVARARAMTTAVRADREACRQLVGVIGDAGHRKDDTWELLTSLAEREGRFDLAERAARAVGSRDAAGFRRLYDLLYRQKKWNAILELCDSPGRPATLAVGYYQAVPLAELGQGSDALAALETLAPSLGVRLERVRVYNILGKHKEAAAECRIALKEANNPKEVFRVRHALADSLNGLKDYTAAESELRAVLDDDPDDVLALNNLGYNLADQGRKLEEAEELIRRAIQIDRDNRARAGDPEPENGIYGDSLGWVLFRRGKLTDSRQVLEAAVVQPDSGSDAVVWDHLGDVAFRQGDAARAREAWTKAVTLYANSHQGKQANRRDEAVRKLRLVP